VSSTESGTVTCQRATHPASNCAGMNRHSCADPYRWIVRSESTSSVVAAELPVQCLQVQRRARSGSLLRCNGRGGGRHLEVNCHLVGVEYALLKLLESVGCVRSATVQCSEGRPGDVKNKNKNSGGRRVKTGLTALLVTADRRF
jgi:hypothetical protein